MSKILKNQTVSDIPLDIGLSVPGSGQLLLNTTDYLEAAGSDDIVTHVGSGDLVVNDGSSDLSINDGIKLIQGIFPNPVGIQGSDGTQIGNNGNRLNVDLGAVPSAFGDFPVSQLSKVISVEPTNGLNLDQIEIFTSGTGSAANVHDNLPTYEFHVESGTSVGGYGVLRSKRTISYKPGVGTLARYTARFDTPVALSIQRAGLFNIGNELSFGYDGTTFGILRKVGGRPEIRTLTITTDSNVSTNVTVTLNGTAKVIAVSNGTAAENAEEIASAYTLADGWTAYNIDDTVFFQAAAVEVRNGTYSASPASGAFVGSFTTQLSGRVGDDTWVYQADWNQTTLTGVDDPFILDHTKGNVYQIQLQYLGYGAINFYIENPTTGAFVLVHKIQYANQATQPSLELPHFKVGIIVASAGSTTNLTVHSASMAAFEEIGTPLPVFSHSASGNTGGIGSTNFESVLALQKTTISNDLMNVRDIKLQLFTAAGDSTKPVLFELRLNPTFADPMLWESNDSGTPIVSYSGGGVITGGKVIYAAGLSKSSNTAIDLSKLGVILNNNDVVVLCAKATSGTVDGTGSFVWSIE